MANGCNVQYVVTNKCVMVFTDNRSLYSKIIQPEYILSTTAGQNSI